MSRSLVRRSLVLLTATLAIPVAVALACPFCSAPTMTLSEELKTSDAGIICSLSDVPATASGKTLPKGTFKIDKVLKGAKLLAGKSSVEMLYSGKDEPGTKFLVFGVDPKQLAWGTPLPITDRGVEYLEKVAKLSDAPVERLPFFQNYFEDVDPLLSDEAFNEFARAPYTDVMQIKDQMPHDKLVGWIKDPQVSVSRRRLYLTMLGMCGTADDVPMIEGLIKNEQKASGKALDAAIGCYLSLKRSAGLPLIDEMFLKNKDAEYVDTYSAIVALRVIGQETDLIPKKQLVEAFEHVLERPDLADIVVPDLARWQDWQVMDRLVNLFKTADQSSSWVRVPVVQFLRACPQTAPEYQQAQAYIKELAALDPDAVKRASNFLTLPGTSGPAPAAGGSTPVASDNKEPVKDQANAAGGLKSKDVGKKDASVKQAKPAEGVAPASGGGGGTGAPSEPAEAASTAPATEGAALDRESPEITVVALNSLSPNIEPDTMATVDPASESAAAPQAHCSVSNPCPMSGSCGVIGTIGIAAFVALLLMRR